jgi:hypothetical protein
VFNCAKVLSLSATQDADPAADQQTGIPYINGCAPGFEPVQTKSTNDTRLTCVALCKPGVTSQGSPANAQGLVGSGHTCANGPSGPTECRYWSYLEDTSAAGFPDASSNTLGFCMDYTQYMYDSDKNGTPDTMYPSCTTLSDTAHNFDATLTDTVYWGCAPHP